MRTHLILGALMCLVTCGLLEANPAWWTDSLIDSGVSHDVTGNYAPANVGQLKNFARQAEISMNSYLPGGAGDDIETLMGNIYVADPSDNYKPCNLGQLKAVAKLYYDRMQAAGYDTKANLITNGYPSTWGSIYPWDPSTDVTTNYAPANLGQLKAAFSFEIFGQPLFYPGNDFVPNGGDTTLYLGGYDSSGSPLDLSGVTWTVSGGGTITGSGESASFVSNGTPGSYVVTATYGTRTISHTITVYTPVAAYLSVWSSISAITHGSSTEFTVYGYDQYGNPLEGSLITWTVSGGGTLSVVSDLERQFTAGGTDGTFTVTVTSGSVSANATVTVYTPALQGMYLDPSEPVLIYASGEQLQFTVYGYDQYGNPIVPPGLTWTLPTGGGSITSAGLFTPSGVAGTYTVRVTSGSIVENAAPTIITSLSAAVQNLLAVARNNRVELHWDAYVTPAETTVDHYNIYRATSATGPFTLVANTTDTMYIDRGLTNGTTYWYKVTAVVVDQYTHQLESPASTIVSATPVATAYVGAMDVAFVVDNTASMGGGLSNIQEQLVDIIGDIDAASGHDYRVALVTPDTEASHVRVVFSSNNGSDFSTAVEGLTADGGGNAPESTDVCLSNVLNAANGFTPAFRSGVKKIVVMITDALPSGGDDEFVADATLTDTTSDEYHAHADAVLAQTDGVQIASTAMIDGSSSDDPAAFYRIMHDYYAALTTPSGSTPAYVEVPPDGQGTTDALFHILYP